MKKLLNFLIAFSWGGIAAVFGSAILENILLLSFPVLAASIFLKYSAFAVIEESLKILAGLSSIRWGKMSNWAYLQVGIGFGLIKNKSGGASSQDVSLSLQSLIHCKISSSEYTSNVKSPGFLPLG